MKHKIQSLILCLVLLVPLTNICAAGAAADTAPDYFTIAVLPDTQFYAASYPAIFDQQTQWLADNAAALNIVFVAHVGDLVNTSSNAQEWVNAKRSMDTIRRAGIPYSVVPGNHDGVTDFDSNFPYTDFDDYGWYGGHFPAASNINNFELFTAMGQDFIILNLIYDPSLFVSATAWANGVLDQFSDRKAIIVTHAYIRVDGSLAHTYPMYQADVMFDTIVSLHSNVIAVLCGHYTGETCSTSAGVYGNVIYNLLTDYQGLDNGGNGWLRLYKFYPQRNQIEAVTYSPYLNQYDTTAGGEFWLDLDMSLAVSASVAGGHGAAVASPAQVAYGGACTVRFTPDDGYRLAAVTDNGADVTAQAANNTYAIGSVTTRHNIAAAFTPVPAWDLNGDERCDVADLVVIGLHWSETGAAGWIRADVNSDGVIDVADMVAVGSHWGESW